MDKRLEELRQQRDEIQNAAAEREAEKERRLANARAEGRAAGSEWARGPAHWERLKKLSEGSPDVIKEEVWQYIREKTESPVAQAYLAAFTEAVNEMLRKVDEVQTKVR